MIGKLFHFIGSWFKSEWQYRIRYETKYNRWVIETNEKGDHERWYAVCETVLEGVAAGELIPVKHESYQQARAYVEQRGLNYGYRETRYLKEPLPANLTNPDGPDGATAAHSRSSNLRTLGTPARTH